MWPGLFLCTFPAQGNNVQNRGIGEENENNKSPQRPMFKGFFDASSAMPVKNGVKINEGQKSLIPWGLRGSGFSFLSLAKNKRIPLHLLRMIEA